MGHNSAAAAASALRLLAGSDLRHPAARGPQPRRATPTSPPAPLNLGLVDHIESSVDEVVTHVRAVADTSRPLPHPVEDLYDWYIAATSGADSAEQAYRDMVIERHALEHAIALGDYDVVRPHPCPACGSWGLMWDERGRRARCSDVECRTPDGLSSSWTLERLAAQKVQRTEIWRRSAT